MADRTARSRTSWPDDNIQPGASPRHCQQDQPERLLQRVQLHAAVRAEHGETAAKDAAAFSPPRVRRAAEAVADEPTARSVAGERTPAETPPRKPAGVKDSAVTPAVTTGGIGRTDAAGVYFVDPRPGERNFYEIAMKTSTDKVRGPLSAPGDCAHKECKPQGHHYDTLYQQRLGPYSRDDTEPFTFVEVGFYNGNGERSPFLDFIRCSAQRSGLTLGEQKATTPTGSSSPTGTATPSRSRA